MTTGNSTLASRWRADWKGLALLLFVLPPLLSLGCWQLQRAEEKRAILADFEQRRQLPPQALATLETRGEADDFRPVLLRGRYHPERYWLMDNRIYQGRFGYEIMALFELASGGQVVVDRGWIAGDPGRRVLPQLAMPAGEVELRGEIYHAPGVGLALATVAEAGWPRRVQWLDLETARAELGESLRPYTVRLFEGEPGSLVVQRPVVNVRPEKHTGYAVQWFGMALIAVIFFLARFSNVFSRALWRRPQ